MSQTSSNESRFGHLSHTDCRLLYKGLKLLLESDDSSGFHNADKGHVFYMSGAVGKPWIEKGEVKGGPADNELYQMLAELSGRMLEFPSDLNDSWFTDFSTWQRFCRMAVSAYKRSMGLPDTVYGED